MGKVKKTKVSKNTAEGEDKYVPLADQILDDKSTKSTSRVKVRNRKEKDDEVKIPYVRISSNIEDVLFHL
jgi:hypothetical protein